MSAKFRHLFVSQRARLRKVCDGCGLSQIAIVVAEGHGPRREAHPPCVRVVWWPSGKLVNSWYIDCKPVFPRPNQARDWLANLLNLGQAPGL